MFSNQRFALIRCNSVNAPNADNFNFGVRSANRANPAMFCTDGLIYRCIARNAYRLNGTVPNCRNLQVIGGEFTSANGTRPEAGWDVEPNAINAGDTINVPAVRNLLFRGVKFGTNNGPAINLAGDTGGASPAHGVVDACTVEGCLIDTQGANPRTDASAVAGVRIHASHILLQYNTFENLNAPNTNGCVRMINNAADHDNVVDNNSFNNCNVLNGTIITSGANQLVSNNRSFNSTSPFVSGSGSTNTNNTTVSGRTDPSPTPPWTSYRG
jgi:hypothetical protein